MKRGNYTSASTTVANVCVIHDWHIVNFPVIEKLTGRRDHITSHVFGTSDEKYQFRAELYPQGINCHNQSDITIHLVKAEAGETLPVFGSICVVMRDSPVPSSTSKFADKLSLHSPIICKNNIFSPPAVKLTPHAYMSNETLTLRIVLQIFENVVTQVIAFTKLNFCNKSFFVL